MAKRRLSRSPRLALITASLLLTLVLPAHAANADCDPQSQGWTADQQYGSGALVFHDGEWYEAGTLNQTRAPGTDPLSWRPLEAAPDCQESSNSNLNARESGDTSADASATTGSANSSGAKTFDQAVGESDCDAAPVWALSKAYAAGDYARHEGQVYRAIKQSQGDLPGVSKPARWTTIDNDCPKP